MIDPDHPDADDAREALAQDRASRRYLGRLSRAPDCRDPEHMGCPACCSDEGPDTEGEDGL